MTEHTVTPTTIDQTNHGAGGPRPDAERVTAAVRERYARAARAAAAGSKAGCGCGCDHEALPEDAFGGHLYAAAAAGLPEGAVAASLGCATPVDRARLAPGEVVLDLGSGGGIDVILAARAVGPTGRAIGLDMTDEMIELARRNLAEAGIENAEILRGRMEEVPLADGTVDAILSNCVVNLSPDKDRVFAEAYRVLRPGGRLALADVVALREVPAVLRDAAELWSACLGGALTTHEVEEGLVGAGFVEPEVVVLRTYGLGDLGSDGALAVERLGIDAGAVDGLFASAMIRAIKPA